MKRFLVALAAVLAAPIGYAANPAVVHPYENAAWATTPNILDERVFATLKERGIAPANPCSDPVFIRRVYLDVIGALPEPDELRPFFQDHRPEKRADLIDALLERNEFADYWALKWCDVLRVKAEFPINLWPNAVQAYHRWIHDAIKTNMPYDQFVRELLTSSGSNFRVPQVNFYRAIQGRAPAVIADAAALTFMGERAAKWPEARRAGLAAFFSRVQYKQTEEWKEEIVQLNPAPAEPFNAVFPDGVSVTIPPERDPREVFADWLLAPGNPCFARNAVNRVWCWLMGRGIIHEPDDIRSDNPPVNPELLACLEKELVNAHYDLRHIYRLILNSHTYQQSSIPHSGGPEAEALFAYYPARPLDAEVLIDALDRIGEAGETYSSLAPEPFSFLPEFQRSIALADGSITSPFLEMFGRPSRDTGLVSERIGQPSGAQRLCLLNSSEVRKKIQNSPRLRRLVQANKKNPQQLVRAMYMNILSRPPTPEEQDIAQAYARTEGLRPIEAVEDVAWALINSKEFLYRH
jgi:hypothetical protein